MQQCTCTGTQNLTFRSLKYETICAEKAHSQRLQSLGSCRQLQRLLPGCGCVRWEGFRWSDYRAGLGERVVLQLTEQYNTETIQSSVIIFSPHLHFLMSYWPVDCTHVEQFAVMDRNTQKLCEGCHCHVDNMSFGNGASYQL